MTVPKRIALLLVALLAVSACQVGPRYARPCVEVPDGWRVPPEEMAGVVNAPWWSLFGDPVLDHLIDRALSGNLDVRLAVARVEEFAARIDVVRAGQLPQVGYGLGAGRERASGALPGGIPPGVSRTNPSHFTSLNLAWDLDVWGRIQSATDAARAEYLASTEVRRTVVQTLVANVAAAYVTLLKLDRQLEVAEDTLKARAETVELFEVKAEGGAISDLEVAQVVSEYHQAAVRVPTIQREIVLLENAMAVLLGDNPRGIPRGLELRELKEPAIPEGLPSELLLRRPDIRQAEYDLVAACANIRVARAEFFPTISLTSFLGYASAALGNLLEASASVAGISGEVLGPIFTGGRLRGQMRVVRAIQRQTLTAYRQTILNALREVDDSLVSIVKRREEYDAQNKRVEALREYLRFAQLRYDEGQVSYIEVLDASRRLFDAELILTENYAQIPLAIIDAYRAMGGGWICTADSRAVGADCLRRKAACEPPRPCPPRGRRMPCTPCDPCPPCPPCCPPCDPCAGPRPCPPSSALPPPPTAKSGKKSGSDGS